MGGADNGGSPLTYRANTTMIRGSYEENNVGKIVKFYSLILNLKKVSSLTHHTFIYATIHIGVDGQK